MADISFRIRLPRFTDTANILDSRRCRATETTVTHRPGSSLANRDHI